MAKILEEKIRAELKEILDAAELLLNMLEGKESCDKHQKVSHDITIELYDIAYTLGFNDGYEFRKEKNLENFLAR